MADIFVSYARADQDLARRIVALLEAQGWRVWWDTSISAGERWDEVIERELKAARCVVVVWTPQSINSHWVKVEAHDGRDRGILVPILAGIDKQPFGFGLIQARNLTGWDGASKTDALVQVLADVRRMLDGAASAQPSSPSLASATPANDAEREWRAHDLDNCDDSGLLRAYAAKWEKADPVWSYKAQQKAAGLEAAYQRRAAEAARRAEVQRQEEEARKAELRRGRIQVDARIVHGAQEGWFKPGAGKTEWFKDLDVGPEMVVVPAGSFTMGSSPSEIAALKKEYVAIGRIVKAPSGLSPSRRPSPLGGSPSHSTNGRRRRCRNPVTRAGAKAAGR